jgi:hypothetical protein
MNIKSLRDSTQTGEFSVVSQEHAVSIITLEDRKSVFLKKKSVI